MRRYSIFEAIPLSFVSRALYRDVAGSWRGIGLAYVMLLVTILTFLVLLRVQLASSRWVHGPAQELADQIPTIVIRHRVVEVDRPMPYTIQDRKTGLELVVVDTTGQITSLDGRPAMMLLTADHLLFRKSTAETRVFSLTGVEHLTISSAKAKRWLTLLSTWASPIAAPFVFGGLLVCRLVQVLVFAVVGLLVALVAKARLGFSALMRLAAVALTPMLVLEPMLELARRKPPAWGTIATLVTFAYLVWGVLANRPPADVPTGLDPVA